MAWYDEIGSWVETRVRLAISTLPAGARGFESGDIQSPSDVPAADYPHAFLHGFADAFAELDFRQWAPTTSVVLEVWQLDRSLCDLRADRAAILAQLHHSSIGAAIPGVRTIAPVSCALAFPANRTGLSILRLELAFKADPLLASG